MPYDPAERKARYRREKARNINLDDYAQNQRRPKNHSLDPAERIRAIMERYGISVAAFAEAMQLPVSTAQSLRSGRAKVSASHAIRLASVLGGDAMDWLRLQVEHDLRKEAALMRKKFTSLTTTFEDPDHWGE
ncbi:helix-turn-helix domain-containing protein [Citrobacter portucalensis]|uniref:helix-turn-helix transcriptional regulator n=1 Tax=Citrobacter portucalensis TaxID=1639133 RepID=UPI00226BB67F|nr:helix-turn-helix domain-containing protein [Citrobacter portucalensis]MCX9019048.1 helix-turn-helix domain-containing protein [Citrobacter portucalensis]